jgi:hypothetical protein
MLDAIILLLGLAIVLVPRFLFSGSKARRVAHQSSVEESRSSAVSNDPREVPRFEFAS